MSAPLLDPMLPPRPRATGSGAARLRTGLLCLLAAFALVAAGCSDEGSEGSGAEGSSGGAESGALADLPEVADSEYEDMTGESSVVIDTRDNTFGPQYVIVSPGTEVTWENRGRNPHNVIAVEAGSFEDVPTDDLQPGDEATRTFDEPGDYPYYCSLHATPSRGMTGRIRVADS